MIPLKKNNCAANLGGLYGPWNERQSPLHAGAPSKQYPQQAQRRRYFFYRTINGKEQIVAAVTGQEACLSEYFQPRPAQAVSNPL